jgi:hypothetical protein
MVGGTASALEAELDGGAPSHRRSAQERHVSPGNELAQGQPTQAITMS